MKATKLFLILLLIFLNANIKAQAKAQDGKIYKTVKIGNQVWLAENLSVSTFRNGDLIPEAKTNEDWIESGKRGKPAWCYYNNDSANGAKYGKLYNWFAVNDYRGLAPVGWHVPTDSEWTKLADELGGKEVAGTKMRSTSGWRNDIDGKHDNGSNESGFMGLPGGQRDAYGDFIFVVLSGLWWSSSANGIFKAYSFSLSTNSVDLLKSDIFKEDGLSIRCLKN